MSRIGRTTYSRLCEHPIASRRTHFSALTAGPSCAHDASWTQHLRQEFLTAFYQSDVLIVMDIYAAGEAPIPGVHARDLADGIASHGHREVRYMDGDRPGIIDYLCESTRSGDLVLTLGAGDVGQLGADLLVRLGQDAEGSKRR